MTLVKVIQVEEKSSLVDEIIKLGDANVKILGILPREAFRQYARNGGLLAAVDDEGNLAGYLLYRTVQKTQVAKIAHLCVQPIYQGKDIPKLLFSELCQRTQLLHGIALLCRNDFKGANWLWERLGFKPTHEKRGRGKQDTVLTYWWYPHPHMTLFDFGNPLDEAKIRVVIDAPIFFDFFDENSAAKDVLALRADWLAEQVEFLVTPELFNQIGKQQNAGARHFYRTKADMFEMVEASVDDIKGIESELRDIYPKKFSDSHRYSLTHLAWAIAKSDSHFFVTQNEKLLSVSREIDEKFKLRILRPTDLILHLHELARVEEYQHMRLAGTSINMRQVKAGEDAQLVEAIEHSEAEYDPSFLIHLRSLLSNPKETPCTVVEDSEGRPLLLFAYQRTQDELGIPLLRASSMENQGVLIRYLLLRFITLATREGRNFTRITESKVQSDIQQALHEDRFYPINGTWLKPNLPVAAPAKEIADNLEQALAARTEFRPYYERHIEILRQPNTPQNASLVTELEKLLFPAKIIDATMSTMLIPIEETWMSLWFDEELASTTLFGADEKRAFNREGIYYSAANRRSIPTPGRLLWYVTGKSASQGTRCVRASARLDEIVMGTAQDLFMQYRHLGIYEWENVLRLAKNDPEGQLMAIRFSDPELFVRPVTYSELEKICLKVNGKKPPIYSASRVDPDVFAQVYKLGMNIP